VKHQRASVAHQVAEGRHQLDIVAGGAQILDHVAIDPGFDLQVGLPAPQVRPSSQRGAVTAA